MFLGTILCALLSQWDGPTALSPLQQPVSFYLQLAVNEHWVLKAATFPGLLWSPGYLTEPSSYLQGCLATLGDQKASGSC